MNKNKAFDTLLDMYETYQYLMTKIDLVKGTLDDVKGENLTDFETEKLLDVIESARAKHAEIDQDLTVLKKILKPGTSEDNLVA